VPITQNDRSKAIKEFSRFAHQYNTYNVIQSEVAREVAKRVVPGDYSTIVDLGCGSGEVYKNLEKKTITFSRFIALDSSREMLSLHPSDNKIEKVHADFNVAQTFTDLGKFDSQALLLSSSAIQWSKDLDFIFGQLSKMAPKVHLAIFTANTFKTLHQTAKVRSPIYSADILRESIVKYYDARFEEKEYRLSFNSVREMFNYIKKSGVSGGEKQLGYTQIKELMATYPLDYLEFEVLFVEATSLYQ
jgi:malonyl-CoA O-methyltransferase